MFSHNFFDQRLRCFRSKLYSKMQDFDRKQLAEDRGKLNIVRLPFSKSVSSKRPKVTVYIFVLLIHSLEIFSWMLSPPFWWKYLVCGILSKHSPQVFCGLNVSIAFISHFTTSLDELGFSEGLCISHFVV